MTLLELNYQRRKARAEANCLLDAAMMEGRTLSRLEQAKFDALAARIDELDNAYAEREALRKVVS